jgi:hypothetical protein
MQRRCGECNAARCIAPCCIVFAPWPAASRHAASRHGRANSRFGIQIRACLVDKDVRHVVEMLRSAAKHALITTEETLSRTSRCCSQADSFRCVLCIAAPGRTPCAVAECPSCRTEAANGQVIPAHTAGAGGGSHCGAFAHKALAQSFSPERISQKAPLGSPLSCSAASHGRKPPAAAKLTKMGFACFQILGAKAAATRPDRPVCWRSRETRAGWRSRTCRRTPRRAGQIGAK